MSSFLEVMTLIYSFRVNSVVNSRKLLVILSFDGTLLRNWPYREKRFLFFFCEEKYLCNEPLVTGKRLYLILTSPLPSLSAFLMSCDIIIGACHFSLLNIAEKTLLRGNESFEHRYFVGLLFILFFSEEDYCFYHGY